MSENSVAGSTAEPTLPSGFSAPMAPIQDEAGRALDAPFVAPMADEGEDSSEGVEEKIPTIALIAAGLTVFDAILTVAIVGLWCFARPAMMNILPALAAPALLFGIAPVLVGGVIQNRARKGKTAVPGDHWGRWGIISGVFLSSVTLMIPLMSALAALTKSVQ